MTHAHLIFRPAPGAFCSQCMHPDGGDGCWQWEMRVAVPADNSGQVLMHSTRFCRHCYGLTRARLFAIRANTGVSFSSSFDETPPIWLDLEEVL
jgi:hypothetical protein